MSTSSPQSNPSVPSVFQPNYNTATRLINGQIGQQAPSSAFQVSPTTTGAINYAGNIFSPGGTANNSSNYINSLLNGGPMGGYNSALSTSGGQTLNNIAGGGGAGNPSANPYGGTINQILSGYYSNPSANPALAGEIGALGTNFGQQLNQGIDAVNSQTAGAGQGVGGSINQGQMGNILNQALQTYTGGVSNLLGSNYNTSLGLINPALNTGVQSYETATGNQQSAANSLLSLLGGQENLGLGAIGASSTPVSEASTVVGLGQIPQELGLQQFQANENLNQLPIQELISLMQGTPVSYPAYGQSPFSEISSGIGNLFSGAGNGLAGISKIL